MTSQTQGSGPEPGTARKIARNTASLLISGIIAQVISAGVMIYLARILGPADFGNINFAVAIVAYFTLIANVGLPTVGTRDVARDKSGIAAYAGSVLTLRLCLSLAGFVLLLLVTFLLDRPAEIKYLLLLYGIGLIPSALVLDWAFQGVEKMEYIALGRILATVIYAGLVVWFVRSPGQLLVIPLFQTVGNLIGAALLIYIFAAKFGVPRLRFDLVSWRALLRQALPIGVSLFMIQMFYSVDTVLLGFMRSSEEVGYYSSAYRIITVLIVGMGSYYDAIFPLMSNYYKTSMESLKGLLSVTQNMMFTLGIPLAVGGTLLAKPIMKLVFGPGYEDGAIAFQILIWSAAMSWVNTVYSKALLACDRQKRYAIVLAITAIGNLVLNFILIPYWGLVGASISRVSIEIAASVVFYLELRKIVRVPITKAAVRPIFASAIMALAVLVGLGTFGLSVFLLIIGGAILYLFAFFAVGGAKGEEFQLVRGLITRGTPRGNVK